MYKLRHLTIQMFLLSTGGLVWRPNLPEVGKYANQYHRTAGFQKRGCNIWNFFLKKFTVEIMRYFNVNTGNSSHHWLTTQIMMSESVRTSLIELLKSGNAGILGDSSQSWAGAEIHTLPVLGTPTPLLMGFVILGYIITTARREG
jgi:hypothetical protein